MDYQNQHSYNRYWYQPCVGAWESERKFARRISWRSLWYVLVYRGKIASKDDWASVINSVLKDGVPSRRLFMISIRESRSSFASKAWMFWPRIWCATTLQDLVSTKNALRPSSIYQDCSSRAWHAAMTASASSIDFNGALRASLSPLQALNRWSCATAVNEAGDILLRCDADSPNNAFIRKED